MNYTKRILSPKKQAELACYQFQQPTNLDVLKLEKPQITNDDESVVLVEGLVTSLDLLKTGKPFLIPNQGYYKKDVLTEERSFNVPFMDSYVLAVKGIAFLVVVDPRDILLHKMRDGRYEYVERPSIYDIRPIPKDKKELSEEEMTILKSISDQELIQLVKETLTAFICSYNKPMEYQNGIEIRDRRGEYYDLELASGQYPIYRVFYEGKEYGYGKISVKTNEKYKKRELYDFTDRLISYYCGSWSVEEAISFFEVCSPSGVYREEYDENQYHLFIHDALIPLYGDIRILSCDKKQDGIQETVWSYSIHGDLSECEKTPDSGDKEILQILSAIWILREYACAARRHISKAIFEPAKELPMENNDEDSMQVQEEVPQNEPEEVATEEVSVEETSFNQMPEREECFENKSEEIPAEEESFEEIPVSPILEVNNPDKSSETAYKGCLNYLWQVILLWVGFIILDSIMWLCVVDGPFRNRPFHVLAATLLGLVVFARETALWYWYKR